MKTPLCDFVASYVGKVPLRAHMPGHKGQAFLGPEALDITEIDGADLLYHATGVIRESEDNAASLFGSRRTLFSAEGSSLSLRAMLFLLARYAAQEGKEPRILAGRNAHKVMITAAAFCGLEVNWLYAGDNVISCPVTPSLLEERLSQEQEPPVAVYLTSPDYLGHLLDIAGLAAVCQRHGVLLVVDNAHGAYLRFLPKSLHPLDLGADLCCDSAHKTLPALTGAGYLHIGRQAPLFFAENAPAAMALFASTSPSYLILQSLDRLNAFLADEYRPQLASFVAALVAIKARLTSGGYTLWGEEPLKLTLAPKSRGETGLSLADALMRENIYPEFADPDALVLMLSPSLSEDSLVRLERLLLSRPVDQPLTETPPKVSLPRAGLSPREALFAPSETLPAAQSLGRIMADPLVFCPPAIPIVSLGEIIDEQALALFAYYGIHEVRVVSSLFGKKGSGKTLKRD